MSGYAEQVASYFSNLQGEICKSLETLDGQSPFSVQEFPGPDGTLARPRVLSGSGHIEKAAVQFTHSKGANLPEAATKRNPHLAGLPFSAVAISLIVHPLNPYVPTTHMNLRFFLIQAEEPVWYFGGGFDLTPYYGFVDDARHWHQICRGAAGEKNYAVMKQACDDYFYLPHRDEHRGIGGLFFDDYTGEDSVGDFEQSFQFVRAIGEAFLPAYTPIFERRVNRPFGERERAFQLYRRGRYAEFNLAIDRGTKYGLQSGRRVESVLASLPPLVSWHYQYEAPGEVEDRLVADFLTPRDWLATTHNSGD